MIYKSIVGSRSYGLDVAGSDVDIAVVSDKHWVTGKPNSHIILWTPDAFAVLQKGPCRRWVDCTMLFPHEFCIVNALSEWIIDNREEMVKALLPELYGVYTEACADFDRHVRGDNKRVMYAIHFRNMLANYADGMTFAEALKPQGADRVFLIAVRNGMAPKGLVVEATAKARERAKAAAGFYAEPKANAAILDEFKHMVYRELGLIDKGRRKP